MARPPRVERMVRVLSGKSRSNSDVCGFGAAGTLGLGAGLFAPLGLFRCWSLAVAPVAALEVNKEVPIEPNHKGEDVEKIDVRQ